MPDLQNMIDKALYDAVIKGMSPEEGSRLLSLVSAQAAEDVELSGMPFVCIAADPIAGETGHSPMCCNVPCVQVVIHDEDDDHLLEVREEKIIAVYAICPHCEEIMQIKSSG